MTTTRTITLIIGEDGKVQAVCGGDLPAELAADVCRAMAVTYDKIAVEEEVQRRVAEALGDGTVLPGVDGVTVD